MFVFILNIFCLSKNIEFFKQPFPSIKSNNSRKTMKTIYKRRVERQRRKLKECLGIYQKLGEFTRILKPKSNRYKIIILYKVN